MMRGRRRTVAGAAAIVTACALIGCESQPGGSEDSGTPTAVPTKPVPAYEAVAAKYNERANRIPRLWARAVVRLTYADEKGEVRTDQGEGVLQLVRPDRVGLSIKKAGKMLFWLGCDAERYWFFDVVDEKVARVGKNPRENELQAGDAAGIGIPPRELFELIGMIPLDPAARGTLSWSNDGTELVLTIEKQTGGTVVGGATALWLNPTSYEPTRVERRDANGRVIIGAALADYEGVEVEGEGGLKPRLATKLDAVHEPSGARVRLDLSEMRYSVAGDAAFVFEALKRSMGVERVIDVDEEAGRVRAGSRTSEARVVNPDPLVTQTPVTIKPSAAKPRVPVRGTPIAPKKPAGKP